MCFTFNGELEGVVGESFSGPFAGRVVTQHGLQMQRVLPELSEILWKKKHSLSTLREAQQTPKTVLASPHFKRKQKERLVILQSSNRKKLSIDYRRKRTRDTLSKYIIQFDYELKTDNFKMQLY